MLFVADFCLEDEYLFGSLTITIRSLQGLKQPSGMRRSMALNCLVCNHSGHDHSSHTCLTDRLTDWESSIDWIDDWIKLTFEWLADHLIWLIEFYLLIFNLLVDWFICWFIGWLMYWLTDLNIDWLICSMIYWLIDLLVDWFVWLICWLAYWLIDWLDNDLLVDCGGCFCVGQIRSAA